MASMRTIQITFDDAMRQAKRLKSTAKDLRKSRSRMEGVMENLNRSWSGEAADSYLQKCRRLSQKMTNTIQALEESAEAVEAAARAYYTAEQRALELIAQRQVEA